MNNSFDLMLNRIRSSNHFESTISKNVERPSLKVSLLNRQISCITVESIIDAIHKACVEDIQITVANYNVHIFNLSMQIPWLYEFLQNAEIAHCDGMGILKGLDYMGLKLPIEYRVSYTVLMPEVLELCRQQKLSLFLLGHTSEHLEAALKNLRQQYPQINVDGHHGFFDRDNQLENQAVVDKINYMKPNILLVGMGSPVQEDWIRKNRDRIKVNVILPGGATIGRLGGIVRDSPEWIANAGLEWLYRLIQEPKRLASRYLIGNLTFAFNLMLAKHNQLSPIQICEIDSENNSSLTLEIPSQKKSSMSKIKTELSAPLSYKVKKFSEYLVEAGFTTKEQVADALCEHQQSQMSLDEILIDKEIIDRQTLEYSIEKNIN
jgi:N-acetylglucosaminyldiphosphoundecaprenol N-acetyl-beta-D-mannosaminyltransferase